MYSDEEKEPTFEMKTWTPEVRNRKIERVRRSVQLSLFSLERATSNQNPTLPEATKGKEESKSHDFSLLVAHKKTSSADVTASKKKIDQFKNIAQKRMLEAVQKEMNLGPVQGQTANTQNLHNLDSLKSLNNSENPKSITDQNNEEPYLNTATDSHTDSEDEESSQSQPEDLIFSPPKKGEHRHSIFYSSSLNEAQELKEELQVEDGQDIYFIQGDFFAYYQEGEILGEGASGTVKKCTKIGTDQIFAVKIVRYRGDTERLFSDVKEFENHKRLNHRNIIKVYELYIDYFNKKTYLVMELVECREMLEVIHENGPFRERVAAKILKQVLSGINYLHLNGVCHRDLKPDNILISQDGEMTKIVDFNVSKFSKSEDYTAISNENYKMWTQTGTIAFTAPEVFNDSQYTEAIDMWSVGVILYTMLCGYQPFQADNVQELIEKIKKAEFEFHSDAWSQISLQAKDLIRCLLNIDVKKRYSPFQALTHPWIENQGNSSPTHTFGTIDHLWSYFIGNGFARQQPWQNDNTASWDASGLKVVDMNAAGQNTESHDENYVRSPAKKVSNILLLSKLTSSFSHIEGKCLNKLPESEGESKTKALLPKIPHFSTTGELPYVVNQFSK